MTKNTKNSITIFLLFFIHTTAIHSIDFAAQFDRSPQEDGELPSIHRGTQKASAADGSNRDIPEVINREGLAADNLIAFLQNIPRSMATMSEIEAPLMKMILKDQQQISPFVLMALEQDRVGLKDGQKKTLLTFTKPQKKPQEAPKPVKKAISNYTLYEALLKKEEQRTNAVQHMVSHELRELLQEWLYRTLARSEGEKTLTQSYKRFYPHFQNWFGSLSVQPVSIDHLLQLKHQLNSARSSKEDHERDKNILTLLNYLFIESLRSRAQCLQEKFLSHYHHLRATYGTTLSNLLEELTRENEILSQASEIIDSSQKDKKQASSSLWRYFGFSDQPAMKLNVAPIVQKHGQFPPYREVPHLPTLDSQLRKEKITSKIIKLKKRNRINDGHWQTLEEEFEDHLAHSSQRKLDQVRREVLGEIQKPRLKQGMVVLRQNGQTRNQLQQAALLEESLGRSVMASQPAVGQPANADEVLNSLRCLFGFYETSALEFQMNGHEPEGTLNQCLLQLRRNLIFQYDENNVWQLSLKPNFSEKWIVIYSIDIFNKVYREQRNYFQQRLETYISVIPILEGFFDDIFKLEVKRIIENAKSALLFNLECQCLASGKPLPTPEERLGIMEGLFNYHLNQSTEVAEAIKRQEDNIYIGDFANSPTFEADRRILRSFVENIFRKNVVECLRKYNFTEEKVAFLRKIIEEKEAGASGGSAVYTDGADSKVTLQMPGTIREESFTDDKPLK